MVEKKAKAKKDDYQKALSAYSLAMKQFRKGDYQKTEEMLKTVLISIRMKKTSWIGF